MSCYRMPRAWHPNAGSSCARKMARSSASTGTRAKSASHVAENLGPQDATLRFYPQRGAREKTTFLINPPRRMGIRPFPG